MATSPRFPEEQRPRLVERREAQTGRPFPWLLVAAILTIAVAAGIAWYFFR